MLVLDLFLVSPIERRRHPFEMSFLPAVNVFSAFGILRNLLNDLLKVGMLIFAHFPHQSMDVDVKTLSHSGRRTLPTTLAAAFPRASVP